MPSPASRRPPTTWRVALASTLLLLMSADGTLADYRPESSAVQVIVGHVNSTERFKGQGTLFRHLDTCYLITAGHVVAPHYGSRPFFSNAQIVGGRDGSRLGFAYPVEYWQEPDVALMRVEGDLARSAQCNMQIEDLETPLVSTGKGLVTRVVAQQGLRAIPVLFLFYADDRLAIKAEDALRDQLQEGFSGALATKDGIPAGILIRVVPTDDRLIEVLSIRTVVKVMRDYFEHPSVPPVAPNTVAGPGSTSHNLLDPSAGAGIIKWTSLAIDAEHGPERLLERDSAKVVSWVTLFRPGATTVDLRRGGSADQTVKRIEINAPVDQPPARWPAAVEILGSATGEDGSFESIVTVALHVDQQIKSVLFGQGYRYLRLVVHKNFGDANFVALGRLRAFAE